MKKRARLAGAVPALRKWNKRARPIVVCGFRPLMKVAVGLKIFPQSSSIAIFTVSSNRSIQLPSSRPRIRERGILTVASQLSPNYDAPLRV